MMAKFDESIFEEFRYDEGEPEELVRRALVLCDFLVSAGEDIKEELIDRISECEDEKEVGRIIDDLAEDAVDADVEDESSWADLYEGLFDSSLLIMESSYIPKEDEIEDLVKECIRKKKRVKIDIQDGCIA